jgi:hypothetical protein
VIFTNGIANNTVSRIGACVFDGTFTDFSTAIHFVPFVSTQSITLPANGYRLGQNGVLYSRGLEGRYWTSTYKIDPGYYQAYFAQLFASNASTGNNLALLGLSLRCISE